MPKQSINITFDIIETAKSHPNNVAIIYRNSRIDYKTLDLIIWKGSSFLRGIGITPGDVIAVHTILDWNTLILMLSITRMGGTVISLPPSMSEIQAKETLRDAGVKYIAGDTIVPFPHSMPFVEFNFDIIKGKSIDEKALNVLPRAPWIIVSGSGTTGRSKLIPITHQVQRYRNEMSHEWLGLKRDDVVASMSHFGFYAPKNRLLETLWAGGSYFIDFYKEKDILNACNNYLTVLHATVFHIQKLLLECENNVSESLSIRALTVGGSSVPFNIKRKIKQHLTSNLIVRYASNETGPIAHITQPHVFNQDNCVGKPISNVKINILNIDTQPISKGESGLIALHSPGNFDGYLIDQDLNSRAFTQYGFILGDLGRFDEEGNIYHLGRFDQMMIFNGINIYPAEIERALLAHPKVDDAISFPIHHPIHQDIPVAAISLNQDETLGEEEILYYCKSVLGSHSPHRVFILDKLPRNERGKLVVANLLNEIRKV
jgi:acyl-coenzyme A synthetase/AMP-(fatty) acid ligase